MSGMIRPVPMTAGSILLAWCLGGPPAHAGTGSAVSAPATVDTHPPAVAVVRVTPGTLFQGGQILTFTFSAEDDHPGTGIDDHLALGLDGAAVLDSVPFAPGPGGSWDWILPEIASAQVKVRARATDAFGNVGTAETPVFTVIPSVTEVPGPAPAFRFGPAAPNPFNPRVSFALDLPAAGFLTVRVFDARGRLMRRLAQGEAAGGSLILTWDGTDAAGRRAAAGAYLFLAEFESPDSSMKQVRKAILLP
jgi:hypothetical protein